MEKTGLVLEGGGMRGIYTAGVLDVLMEHRVGFDGVIGVSAGAVHGCSFVSGQNGRSIRYYRKYSGDKRFMSIHNFFRTGDVVDEEFCYHEIPDLLDPFDHEAYEASKTEFYVTCSNLETGNAEYIRITDMRKQIDYMRASASLPFFSRIVEMDGKKLLDGGCTDSVPVRAFMDLGFERNVVVLTRPGGYRKKPEKAGIANVVYRRYPKFAEAIRNRYLAYNEEMEDIRKLEAQGRVFVICPSEDPRIGRMEHDVNEIQRVYEIGRKDAEHELVKLKEWLK